MKSDHPVRIFLVAFLIAVALYVTFYAGIEHRRARKGPWEVTFITNSDGSPAIILNQPKLAITNVQITFPGASVPATKPTGNDRAAPINYESGGTVEQLPTTLLFKEPRPVPYEVPFGQCVFMDLISLPGTVAFKLFGHEIELLPRVLVIDRQEHAWRSDSSIVLPGMPESAAPPHPDKI